MLRIRRPLHENRLRQIELAGDFLHALIAQTVCVEHDRQAVAGEGLRREDIERMELELHCGSKCSISMRAKPGIR